MVRACKSYRVEMPSNLEKEFREIQAKLRREYSGSVLDESVCLDNPFDQFRVWFDAAVANERGEVNAMSLSTVSGEGRVSSRMVLLKDLTSDGLIFFTNSESRKGIDMSANNRVALLFYWPLLERQVRIEGDSSPVSDAVSDAYFSVRPRMAQLGASVSLQSRRLTDRKTLEADVSQLATKLGAETTPRPKAWIGYKVAPVYFEFWQGREDRLHDRIVYERDSNTWSRYRLYP